MMPISNTATGPAQDDEAMLVSRVAAGDRKLFERLMRLHNRRMYRIARAVLRNHADAQDAMQEAYLSAYGSLSQFRGDASLATWLSRLVLNECLGRLRRDARRQNVVPLVRADDEMNMVSDQDRDRPENQLARAQLRALLERKLDDLPVHFRVVFVLRTVEDLTVEETASLLGIAEATVRSRLFRAKSLLRESLAQEIDLAELGLYEFGGAQCDSVVAGVFSRLSGSEPAAIASKDPPR